MLQLSNGAEVTVSDLPFYIGRRAQSDLVIQDPRVSNTHCALERGAQGSEPLLFIRDLRSRNGTMLRRAGDDLIVHGAPLAVQEGDLIMLGDRGGEVHLKVVELHLNRDVDEVETATAAPSRPLDPPTLLATPLPPSRGEEAEPTDDRETSQADDHLYQVALSLSSALGTHEVASEALRSVSPILQRAHVARFYPMSDDTTGQQVELPAPVELDEATHPLSIDPTQVRLAVTLNKRTPLHMLPETDPELNEGLIIPVRYRDKALGALVVACVHPPLSSATRTTLYDLSALLGARLHSAGYYQALKASAEELVSNYEALYRAHVELIKRAEGVGEGG